MTGSLEIKFIRISLFPPMPKCCHNKDTLVQRCTANKIIEQVTDHGLCSRSCPQRPHRQFVTSNKKRDFLPLRFSISNVHIPPFLCLSVITSLFSVSATNFLISLPFPLAFTAYFIYQLHTASEHLLEGDWCGMLHTTVVVALLNTNLLVIERELL